MIKNKKIISIICLLVIIINFNFISIDKVKSSELLGTNLALGSPLLNNSFKTDEWDKWELLTFGVFLSNFTYPLVDDYSSAFTVGNRGSNGEGFKALHFGSGSDPSNHEVLKSLLNYVISIQRDTNNLKRVYVKNKNFTLDKSNYTISNKDSQIDYSEATIKDMLKEDLKTDKFMQATEYNLPTLYVKSGRGEDEGSYTTIFSYESGWDIQMLTAWMSRITLGEYNNKAKDNLDKLLNSNAPIYFDMFGNIVAIIEGYPCIIFPASSNQYITSDNSYNLLTSVLFGGNYITANKSTIIDKFEASKNKILFFDSGYKYAGSSGVAGSKSYIKPGSTIITYDTYVSKSQASDVTIRNNVGLHIANVLSADINKKSTNMGFNVDVVNLESISGAHDVVKGLADSLILLSTFFPVDPSRDKLNYIQTGKEKINIFDEPVLTSVMIGASDDSHKEFSNIFFRRYIDYIQQYVSKGNIVANTDGLPSQKETVEKIKLAKTKEEVATILLEGNNGSIGSLLASFITINSSTGNVSTILNKEEVKGNKKLTEYKLADLKDAGYKVKMTSNDPKLSKSGMNDALTRIIKIYPANNTIRHVSDVLSIRKNTEFSTMSPYIYMSYLEFYGVTKGRSHKYNTALFNGESDIFKVDIERMVAGSVISEEDKRAKIIDYSYNLLDPEKGREYRSNMAMNDFSDWVHKTYQKIVNAGATEYYTSGSNMGNRHASGFLHIDSYTDNFLTSWFMNQYTKYILLLLGLGIVAIFIIAIIKRKKIIWVFAATFTLVTILTIIPIIGDITPYITNNSIQNMFRDKMSYWAISESLANYSMEEKEYGSLNDLGSEESTYELMKLLNITFMDRSLMIKHDISKKITEANIGNLEEIQKIQSARWMLPILMRQFTASDGNADYIYTPLADAYDNISNLYWFYNPNDAINVKNRAAYDYLHNFDADSVRNQTDIGTKTMYYMGYKETSNYSAVNKGMYNNINFDTSNWESGTSIPPGWESLSRNKDDSEVVHTGSYILKDLRIPYLDYGELSYKEFKMEKIWEKFLEDNLNNVDLKNQFIGVASNIEQTASKYDSNNPSSTVTEYFGYLWNSESALPYFYQVVKDTFGSGASVAKVAGELQGTYRGNNRESLMHYRDTGTIRDFLDMQELFTNVIPYMYKVHLLANGNSKYDGFLEGNKIEHYSLYTFLDKGWLLRCNWATKLMESNSLNSKTKVWDKDGNVYEIKNPLDPSCYPIERPMIFSEAQMKGYGLVESELTMPELRILKVNEKVAIKWTTYLNYVNIPNITSEILYRQMAIDAVMEFNKEFSGGNRLSSTLALYPNSIDLRSISFDSIMKMMVLNTTANSSFIYGDTMKNIVHNTDMFSAILLLIAAFICSIIIPLIRNVLLAALLALALWALFSNITSSKFMKIRITTAYIINNILFLLLTILYYGVFAVIINSSYRDDILTLNNVNVSIGNVTWIFIIAIIASVAYVAGVSFILFISIKHRKDLGFGYYAMVTGGLLNNISNKINGGQGMAGGISNKKIENKEISINNKEIKIYNQKNRVEEEDIDLTNENYDYSNREYDRNENRREKSYEELSNFIDEQIKKGSR